MNWETVADVQLTDSHPDLGRTVHASNGIVLPKPVALRIVQNAPDSYYLYYLDSSGNEQTDTWHESIESALEQAEFEFGVQRSDWTWKRQPENY